MLQAGDIAAIVGLKDTLTGHTLTANTPAARANPLVLEQINIVVRDMPKALAFYRLLGVSIVDVSAPEWAEWTPHHANGVTSNGVRVDDQTVEDPDSFGYRMLSRGDDRPKSAMPTTSSPCCSAKASTRTASGACCAPVSRNSCA